MDRVAEMRTLIAVAEAGSFSKAASRLGLTPPTVTRSIAALEQRLGARLIIRTTRSLRLTDAGVHFVEDAKRVLAEMEFAHQTAAGQHGRARGMLRLTAPVLFGEMYLMPVLREFLQQHTEISASVLLLDRITNLIEEGLDLALRIGPADDTGLEVVELGRVRRMVVAAPSYLQRYGRPQQPQDLAQHRIVHSVGASASLNWNFGQGEHAFGVRINPVLSVSTLRAAISEARAGWMLTRVLSYQVQDDLAAGHLVALLEEFEPAPLPVCLVFPRSRIPSARLMAFVELASQRLATVLET
ncbi:MAG: LysR family transcriptional regulator [Rhodanobacteraceae bacterium]|nr:LysR family transcriptional regulator [Rhodanobacteraceae bacterium]